jgi:hypothetical protein
VPYKVKTIFIYWFNLMGYELGRKRENFGWENINKRKRGRCKDVRELIANGVSSDSVCS